MKKKLLCLITLCCIITPVLVHAESKTELKEDKGKTYCYKDGQKQTGFQIIDGKTYFFSRINDNAMRTGTFSIDGDYYHFDEDGKMLTGWYEEDDILYYFSEETGKRVKGFQIIDGKTYFFSRINDNAMRMGTFSIDGDYYHFNEDGTMYIGILEENKNKYYYDTKTGKRMGGFQTVDGNTYFFSRINDNAMRTGTFSIDGDYYHFNEDGKMLTGWYEENNNTYYFGKDGKKSKGFQSIENDVYFFSRINDNAMRTGTFQIDRDYYHFNEDGKMLTGWYEENDNTYYFGKDGKRQVGIIEIDGKKYFFNNNGIKSSGFQQYKGSTYFFSRINDNAMRTGFFQIDDYYCYFKPTGEMVMGFATTPDGIKRFFSRVNGHMRTGWVQIDGFMYYFIPDTGEMVTGERTIDDVNYVFNESGKLRDGFVTDVYGNVRYYFPDGSFANDWITIAGTKYFFNSLGVMIAKNAKKMIDISYHNKEVDWWTAKNKGGVDATIIRVAYRGYGTGVLVNDSNYEQNIKGAIAQGISIGVYVYSQAVTVAEAYEEADRAVSIVNNMGGHEKITLPIVIDTEYTDVWENGVRAGRADYLSREQRTIVVKAFLERVQRAGYEPMIYASKNFLEKNLDMSQIGNYKIWVAQYYHYCTYTGIGNKVMWQYSSTEQVAGINGNVDVSVMF